MAGEPESVQVCLKGTTGCDSVGPGRTGLLRTFYFATREPDRAQGKPAGILFPILSCAYRSFAAIPSCLHWFSRLFEMASSRQSRTKPRLITRHPPHITSLCQRTARCPKNIRRRPGRSGTQNHPGDPSVTLPPSKPAARVTMPGAPLVNKMQQVRGVVKGEHELR